MRWFLVLGTGMALACTGETDIGTKDDTATTMTEPEVCEATIASIDPAPDTREVEADQTVTVTFTGPVPDDGWTLEVTGITGVATLSADGTSVTYVPDMPFEFETLYTITARACDDVQTADFLTVDTPVDPVTLEGTTFGIQEDQLNVIEPKVADAFLTLFEEQGGLFGTLAVELTTYDAGSGDFAGIGAVIDDGTNEFFCEQSVTFSEVDFTQNPTVSFGPDDLPIELSPTLTITLEQLEVVGRVSPEGDSLISPTISLLLAIEELPGSPFTECLDSLGSCMPCTSSETGSCLLFVATVEEAMMIDRSIAQECMITP